MRQGGACRVDGCAVFVPNAAPDEEYDLRITHVGRHAAYGRIERILTASPDRCTRLCPDAKRCGGCDFWHLRYPAAGILRTASKTIGSSFC